MGTRSRGLSGYTALHTQEKCDPEEYDFEDVLDNYSLPVDTHEQVNTSPEVYRRPVFLSCGSTVAAAGAVSSHPGDVNNSNCRNHKPLRPGTHLLEDPQDHRKAGETDTQPHNDLQGCSCPCCVHSDRGHQERRRTREKRLLGMADLEGLALVGKGASVPRTPGTTRSLAAGAAATSARLGDARGLEASGGGRTAGKGTSEGGRATRRSHNKPGFLKTVSIIDTLSELAHGPEVRRLAQEQRTTRPARPHSGSRVVSRANTSSSGATTSSSSTGITDTGDELQVRPPGPPVLSADFQQYCEQIYDAVTSPPKPPSLLLGRDGRSRVSGVPPPPRRREKSQPRVELRTEEDTNSQALHPSSHRDDKDAEHRVQPDHRSRERGRTPDWIKRIFDIAKKGDLPALKRSVSDMEGTLIRNLIDHSGNNLLHVMAVFGHLAPLAWLLTTHQVLVDALHDENKFGLTPLVCAVKYGRLRLVHWLVENTAVRDKVRCKDGERSLLHIGAKYAQEEIVEWVVNYMMTHEIPLDNKDHHGNTALHLASRTGNSRVCSILLQHGADVTLKNDVGQKAWEVCIVRSHLACAEYLCVHESGLALATDLTRREAELETAMTDNQDLRVNFKEVLSVARRLVKEREDVVRELSRLHDHMVEAHDNIIMALQVLAEENNQLRDRANGVRQSQHAREQVETVIGYVTGLHERWGGAQKTWFGSSLVDMEHKMLLVEEAWKKLRHRSHRTVATTHHPLDVFRAKLGVVRSQGGDCLGDFTSLCSSEESLVSMFPFSEDDDGIDDYPAVVSSSQFPTTKAATPSTTTASSTTPTLGEVRAETHPIQFDSKSLSGAKSEPPKESDLVNKKESTSIDGSDESPLPCKALSPSISRLRPSTSTPAKPKDSPVRPYWADASLSPSLEQIIGVSPGGEKLGREEISARLREMALVSESGSCSVLEVIEPSSDESEGIPEDDFGLDEAESHNASRRSSHPRASEESSSGDIRETRLILDRRQKRGIVRSRHDEPECGVQGEATTTSSESGTDTHIIGGKSDSHKIHPSDNSQQNKHYFANETSPGTAAADVSEIHGQRHLVDADGKDMAPQEGNSISAATYKRKGFIKFISMKSRWPSKRKVKTIRKVPELSARDFHETYGNVRGSSLSLGPETDAQTTTESNTSSSQEYSNSSEESSIGKPSTSTSTVTQPIVKSAEFPEIEGRHRRKSGGSQAEKRSEVIPSTNVEIASIGQHPPTPPPISSRRIIIKDETVHRGQPPTTPPVPPTPDRYISCDDSLPPVPEERVAKTAFEARSVAASEDSGIVARPASSASKSDSVSRPDSSSSSFPPFKSDYNLQKGFSLTRDHLPTPDSSTAGRMSPAPSEVSKTESALSPPSQASDVSKSESARQFSVGKGSVGGSTSVSSKEGSGSSSSDYSLTLLPLKKPMNVKTAAIIDISMEQKDKKNDHPNNISTRDGIISNKKEEKPWYELSDEESDILLPDRLTSKVVTRPSSSEDEAEVC